METASKLAMIDQTKQSIYFPIDKIQGVICLPYNCTAAGGDLTTHYSATARVVVAVLMSKEVSLAYVSSLFVAPYWLHYSNYGRFVEPVKTEQSN